MATIDKINIGNTVYDISTTSVTTVTLGEGGEDVGVLINQNTQEIDIIVTNTKMVAGEDCAFYVSHYLDPSKSSKRTIFGLNDIDYQYGLTLICKLIKTGGEFSGFYIAKYRGNSETSTSTRMYTTTTTHNFSAANTLVLNFLNYNEQSSGTIDVVVVQKK